MLKKLNDWRFESTGLMVIILVLAVMNLVWQVSYSQKQDTRKSPGDDLTEDIEHTLAIK